MDHSKLFLLNFSRALLTLESLELCEPCLLETVRTNKAKKNWIKRPSCGLKTILLDALLDPETRMRFFNEDATDFEWRNDVKKSLIKRSIQKMFLHPLENYPHSFAYCFKKKEREAKERAASLTSSQLQSSSEDEVEPVKKRLRSSGPPSPPTDNAIPSTSTDRSFQSNASELWETSAAPLDELDKRSLDMRGY